MRALVVFGAASLLTACAVAQPTYGPDGRVAQAIDCGGAFSTWSDCYRRAGEACAARGYDIVTRLGDASAALGGSRYGIFGSTAHTRSLVISCRDGQPGAPRVA